MTKNLKTEKTKTVTTEQAVPSEERIGIITDDQVSTLPHKAIGIYLNEKTKSWEVAILEFNGNTGEAKVSTRHGFKDDDRAIAVERFKIMAVQEGLI